MDPADRAQPIVYHPIGVVRSPYAELEKIPVLDIKPYVSDFDAISAERMGWLEHAARRVHDVRADVRFK